MKGMLCVLVKVIHKSKSTTESYCTDGLLSLSHNNISMTCSAVLGAHEAYSAYYTVVLQLVVY